MSNLEGLQFFADPTLDDIITKNTVEFIKYGLLEVGAYINVATGINNYLGQDRSRLYPVNVVGASGNSIWGTAKSDIIYESDLTLKFTGGAKPTVPTRIYHNGTSVPTGTSVSGNPYYIDFARGHVVFNESIASTTVLQMPHALRAVHVYGPQSNEFRELSSDWERLSPSGIETYNQKNYLPSITVEVKNWKTIKGVELGSRGKVTLAQLEFNIYANNQWELNKLVDMCYMMETKVMRLYNIKTATPALNYRGQLVNPDVNWLYLVNNFPYGEGRFREDFVVTKVTNPALPFLKARARISLEFDSYPS